ncbi:hypothetical protein J2Z83_002564 [Virgibacillus natechei]|uniref:DUF2512 family protein n=1 Tax=Virgibacillus natechei TaxID=1216297 RepID=A0ABS4IHN1_9BACI|nr:YndM family protein [Virgibacillus natechei]MBP1970443.1 hypothetical protein [Virgibacillus natechei]UZD13905.1 YndM family protein [Virgibacillus natechei]
MRHVTAIVIKFLLTAVVVFAIMSTFNMPTFTDMLLISLLTTGLAYIIGDLLILPKFGNTIAAIADFGLATISIWILSYVFIGANFPAFTAAIITGFFLSICEGVFHIYMKRKVLIEKEKENKQYRLGTNQLQTEFSQEKAIHKGKKK